MRQIDIEDVLKVDFHIEGDDLILSSTYQGLNYQPNRYNLLSIGNGLGLLEAKNFIEQFDGAGGLTRKINAIKAIRTASYEEIEANLSDDQRTIKLLEKQKQELTEQLAREQEHRHDTEISYEHIRR